MANSSGSWEILDQILSSLWRVSVKLLYGVGKTVIQFVISVIHTYRKFENELLRVVSELFYGLLPTKKGKLDSHLEDNIRYTLLYVGARFNAFNRSAGVLGSLGFSIGFVTLVIALLMVIIGQFIGIQFPEILLEIFIGLLGLAMVISACLVGASSVIMVLYLGSLLWFSIRKVQPDMSNEGDKVDVYECFVEKENSPKNLSKVKVHVSAFNSFMRSLMYLSLIVLICAVWVISPYIIDYTEILANTLFPPQRVTSDLPIEVLLNLEKSLNALLPINFSFFFSIDGIQSLSVIIFFLLTFSMFLNGKRILQHAELSRLGGDSHEPFTATEEVWRCYLISKISFYHILHGQLNNEFQELRGSILEAGVVVFLTTISCVFYLYVFSNSV